MSVRLDRPDDEEFVIEALENASAGYEIAETFRAASERLRDTKAVALKTRGIGLRFASPRLQTDRELIELAARRYGFRYFSEELRADRELLITAINQHDRRALEFASRELQNDKGVVELSVRNFPETIKFASPELRDDRGLFEMAMNTSRSQGELLEFASPRLRADRGMVHFALSHNGKALEFASHELQADRDTVQLAVQHSGYALEYASSELRADRSIVKLALQEDPWSLQYASDDIRDDRAMVKIAVKLNGCVLKAASKRLLDDRGLVELAVCSKGHILGDLPEQFRTDKEIVKRAVTTMVFETTWRSRVPDKFHADPDINALIGLHITRKNTGRPRLTDELNLRLRTVGDALDRRQQKGTIDGSMFASATMFATAWRDQCSGLQQVAISNGCAQEVEDTVGSYMGLEKGDNELATELLDCAFFISALYYMTREDRYNSWWDFFGQWTRGDVIYWREDMIYCRQRGWHWGEFFIV